MKKLIALYKAFRGGEWFKASLESIAGDVDGIVVVFSDTQWDGRKDLTGNCEGPLEEFRQVHELLPVVTVRGEWTKQEFQYAQGLAAVRDAFGEDSAVLIIDTDEIWRPGHVQVLRRAMEKYPRVLCFTANIRTYLKSPLYQVWQEKALVSCGLQHAHPQSAIVGRFRPFGMTTMKIDELVIDHFSYVRDDDADIANKFHATSSQEDIPSNPTWLTDIWPKLPYGTGLHMTAGSEAAWQRIRVLTPAMLQRHIIDMPLVEELIAREEDRWQDHLRQCPPGDTLIPMPTQLGKAMYGEQLARRCLKITHTKPLEAALKTTYLEAMWLAHWASQVPTGGRILEIGCGSGGSTAVLALASDESITLDTVDPFLPYDEETHAGVARGVREGNKTEFANTARAYGYQDRINHLELGSEEAAPFLSRDGYDLIFVDGNHTLSFVRDDLVMCWPLVKPGGLLTGHDYTTRFPGVIQAADEQLIDFRTPAGTSLFYARQR